MSERQYLGQTLCPKLSLEEKRGCIYTNLVYLVFDKDVHLPNVWKLFREHKIRCISDPDTILEARERDIKQCTLCGGTCATKKCREYK